MSPILWTVGHSTRPFEEFLALLKAHGIRTVADVRRFPSSRRYPHFNKEVLAKALRGSGIRYRPLEQLGGRRHARPDSPNLGWRTEGFRGYADYMATPAFKAALAELTALAAQAPTAIMCAEAVPWRCHRRLISDVLLARGHEVRHILAHDKADLHALTPFAKVTAGTVTYPAPETPTSPSPAPLPTTRCNGWKSNGSPGGED
jgi:uncharacterized protein (DUF488 family)